LQQNYPNPFNPSTTIEFSISKPSYVSLKIFNLLGQEVANLVSENKSAGAHKVIWNPGNMTTGTYFYKLETNDYIETKKLILMR
jgi:hypothetical protein